MLVRAKIECTALRSRTAIDVCVQILTQPRDDCRGQSGQQRRVNSPINGWAVCLQRQRIADQTWVNSISVLSASSGIQHWRINEQGVCVDKLARVRVREVVGPAKVQVL